MQENSYFRDINDSLIKNVFGKLDQKKPKQRKVYHYTSLNSLVKILDSKTLYFTSIEEQNDPQELTFGIKIIKKFIDQLCNNRRKILDIIKNIEEWRDFKEINNIFIFATSADEDDYSQWIKYGDAGAGVSIGIERIKLLELMGKNIKNNTLVYNYPIQYFTDNKNISKFKIKEFDTIIANLFDEICDKYFQSNGTENNRRDFYNLLLIFSSMIKDGFHKDENEWRYIIITNILDENDNSDIIEQNKKLKMIKKIDIEENGSKVIENTIISNFVLGPVHTYDKNMAINLYKLVKKNYENFNLERVKYSKGIIR